MAEQVSIALIQMTALESRSATIRHAVQLLEQALGGEPTLVVLPENAFGLAGESRFGQLVVTPEQLETDRDIQLLRNLSQQSSALFLFGGVAVQTQGASRPHNTIIGMYRGETRLLYQKLHLFDVTTPDGKVYAESQRIAAGVQPAIVQTADCKIGLSICYDLRFPEIYRSYASEAPEFLVVPSAFTRPTGARHWHALLRARAIENQAYVLAPAQCGDHFPGRSSYGHTLVSDADGVLAELAETPGVLHYQADLDALAKLRSAMPCLSHRRLDIASPAALIHHWPEIRLRTASSARD